VGKDSIISTITCRAENVAVEAGVSKSVAISYYGKHPGDVTFTLLAFLCFCDLSQQARRCFTRPGREVIDK
jgi:hypothetical protein